MGRREEREERDVNGEGERGVHYGEEREMDGEGGRCVHYGRSGTWMAGRSGT
jgi:hypothetical protein